MDRAHRVVHPYNKCRDFIICTKGRRLTKQLGFALDDTVGDIFERADCVAIGVLDPHSRRAKVSSAKVRKLAPDVPLRRPTAFLENTMSYGILGDSAAKMGGNEVARGFVNVEAVRHIFAVESEGQPVDDDGLKSAFISGKVGKYRVVNLRFNSEMEENVPFANFRAMICRRCVQM